MNIPIHSNEHASLVQRVVFAFGGKWASGSKEVYTKMPNATMFHLTDDVITWSEADIHIYHPDSILYLGEDECLRLLELMET